MNKTDVLQLLQDHRNERGIKNWHELYPDSPFSSLGMGLTVLRKLAKQVGKDHDLAQALWDSDVYEMKVMSVLVDDPKAISREQVEQQVEDIDFGMMVHVYSACGAPVAKTPFIDEVAVDWARSDDEVRKRCAYGFVYELSKKNTKSAPDDAYYEAILDHIEQTHEQENNCVLLSMGAALMGIGKRSLPLNQRALKIAQDIGPIPVESGKTQCEPMDVSKHLTSEYILGKLKA
ncbi:DNA alkylation repair protein [Marinicella meishanensis]|uniref:DNA alkylation repair protein n=1 Tax=Marinicella meishanensis TaxID=2873263 RepID=UPI001CBF0AEF|nr:DNA alkylation repair protein [Marinicella sp. NBU2979]